jgi:hypothetical protein
MPPASHQVSVTPLKLLIQQIHPHVGVERDSTPTDKVFGTCAWYLKDGRYLKKVIFE